VGCICWSLNVLPQQLAVREGVGISVSEPLLILAAVHVPYLCCVWQANTNYAQQPKHQMQLAPVICNLKKMQLADRTCVHKVECTNRVAAITSSTMTVNTFLHQLNVQQGLQQVATVSTHTAYTAACIPTETRTQVQPKGAGIACYLTLQNNNWRKPAPFSSGYSMEQANRTTVAAWCQVSLGRMALCRPQAHLMVALCK
jgi:hypothetical protein